MRMKVGHRTMQLALVCLVTACSGDKGSSPPPPAVTPVAMSASGPTLFTGTVASAPSALPAVKVTGSNGAPFAGAAVTFQVTSGGGQVTGAQTTTNALGIAAVGGWTLGTAAGTQTMTATSGSLESVTFTARATAAAPSRLTIASGSDQTAAVGTPVAQALQVRATDQYDNPVSGAAISFQVASGGGQLTVTSATTNEQGIASTAGWILGTTPGVNTLTASVGTTASVTFSATASAAAPARLLAVSGDAQVGEPGVALPTPFTVRVTDAYGNAVANVPITFAVSLGSATLSQSTVTSDAQGLAATMLTLTDVGAAAITASSPALTGVSVAFTASTGPSIVGTATVSSSLPRPFASFAKIAGHEYAGAVTSSKFGSSSGGQVLAEAPRLSAKEAASRISTRGRLIVSFKPEAFNLPRSAQAYSSVQLRQQSASALFAALAPLERSALIRRREVSPAIAAVRVDVAAGENPEVVAAKIRADPRVLAVEEDVVLYALEDESKNERTMRGPMRLPPWLAPPPTELYPTDALFDEQSWHYDMIDLPRAWRLTTGSSAVRVAIIDTGVRPDHPAVSPLLSTAGDHFDFTDGVTTAFSSPQTICATGETFTTMRGTAADLALPRNIAQHPHDLFLGNSSSTCWSRSTNGSHGTHVAGTVGSRANDGIGGTGVNWNVTLIAVRVLGVTGSGFLFDVAQGILYAGGLPATYTGAAPGFTVQMPAADIMNLSLGGASPSTALANAITAASANTLIVVSAGNSSTSNPAYPAAYPEALSVVALAPDYALASYTNVGATVDIAAPGGDYRFGASSAVASSTWNFQTGTPNYTYYQGTSMAAPHVTGVAALVKAANPSMSTAQLRARLEQGTIDLGPPGRDSRYGAGLVNAYNSVTGTRGPAAHTIVRAVNSTTGAVVKSASVQGDGRFTFANLPAASYFLVAGQDEDTDASIGIPGRRLGWFGSSGMTPLAVSGSTVRNVALSVGSPVEAEPNDATQQATPLVVNSWVAGSVGQSDARDLFSVPIPAAGTYIFETSGILGACGLALNADTQIRLLDQNGNAITSNDDTAFPVATYPGGFCSYISAPLQPGTYVVEVAALQGTSGSYRLHVRQAP